MAYDNKYGNKNYGNKNYNKSGNKNYNNSGNRNFGNKGFERSNYVGAPYNFVSQAEHVYTYAEDELVKHNEMKDDLKTGEITYEVTAHTPIFVDNGKQQFHQNAKGEYSIPGSTMRGLIKNNVQILGLASIGDDVDDYSLMYRKVASKGKEKKRYDEILGTGMQTINNGAKSAQISVLFNVKAGYISNEGGKYYIYRTDVDSIQTELKAMNYYVVSERKIINDYLASKNNLNAYKFPYFIDNKNILQHRFEERAKGEGFERSLDRNNRVHYKGTQNKGYKPFYREVAYLANGRHITGIYDVKDINKVPGLKKGYLLGSGKMNEKKALYIIPNINTEKAKIQIPQKAIDDFTVDYNRRLNVLGDGAEKAFFGLPKKGQKKPVFYIEYKGRLYFGFTPRLRLFYDYTIHDGLYEGHKEGGKLDYAKALFGYSDNKSSYKSRVSFADAVVADGAKVSVNPAKVILGEPKPTSYYDYLVAKDGEPGSYLDSDFKLRGIKQYWLRAQVEKMEGEVKENVASTIAPLPENTKFVGKIRFTNLTEDELGLLLWSVKLNATSHMNIGKAKSYGYGNISLNITDVKVVDYEKAYKTDSLLDMDPFAKVDVDNTIAAYKSKINQFVAKEYKGKSIDELPLIKEFFMMKDSNNLPDRDKIKYMSIDRREYQNRQKPLQTVAQVIKKD